MALKKITANGWDYLRGVVADPDTPQDIPQPLGPSANVYSLNDPSGLGTHYGALYAVKPSTAVLRLYFDPRNPPDYDSGYIQFGRLTSFGRAVPPEVLPVLASRRFYASKQTDQMFLEFMGPKDANLRLKGGPCEIPFYPLNATLERQFTRLADYETFCWHPMPNGSIRRGDKLGLDSDTQPSTSARRSRCASLVLPISPFLLTESSFQNYCTEENLLLDETISATDANSRSFFDLVIFMLRAGDDDPFPVLKDVQAAGSLLVLTQDDGEEGAGGSLLVARKNVVPNDDSRRRILVWQIGRDAYASIEHNATLDSLERLAAWFATTNYGPKKSINIPLHGRGWKGLRRPPELVYWPVGPLLQLDLLSVIYTRGETVPRPAGVSNRLVWSFDQVAECFDITQKRASAGLSSVNALDKSLALYLNALNNPPAADTYTDSAFTIAGSPWFDSAQPFPS